MVQDGVEEAEQVRSKEDLAETLIKAKVPRLTGAEVLGSRLPDCKVGRSQCFIFIA